MGRDLRTAPFEAPAFRRDAERAMSDLGGRPATLHAPSS
jgi:hypothetical protein